MKSTLRIVLITLLSFGVYFIVDENYFRTIRTWFDGHINQLGISHIIAYITVGIPILLGTILMHRNFKLIEQWGLGRALIKAFAFALLCTLPMFVGYAALYDFNTEFSLNRIC